jgi:hypothetical protein
VKGWRSQGDGVVEGSSQGDGVVEGRVEKIRCEGRTNGQLNGSPRRWVLRLGGCVVE